MDDIEGRLIEVDAARNVRHFFEAHGNFVWRVLARAGVPESQLEDALQEVFIVVSTKIHLLDDAIKPTTWLYGIAIRVAANQRRTIVRRREDLTEDHGDSLTASDRENPEALAVRAEARRQLAELLEALVPEQRIVFEMFELEEMACPTIAETLGIPLGTVYTRLRAARMALTSKAQEASTP